VPFELSGDVEVTRDAREIVRLLDHVRQPFFAARRERVALVDLADEYLTEVAQIYAIDKRALRRLDERDEARVPDAAEPDYLVRAPVTPLPDGSGTVVYGQRHANVDVWEAGVAVSTLPNPVRVVSSRSTYHHDIKIANGDVLREYADVHAEVDPAKHAAALGIKGQARRQVRVHSTRPLVYLYDLADPNAVGHVVHRRPVPQHGVVESEPEFAPPPVPDQVVPGAHYLVTEVLFAAPVAGEPVNWRAFVEPASGAVLYLQSGRADCTGQVYVQDPATQGSTVTPSSPVADLDPLRTTVTLNDLTAADPQGLSGTFVTVAARGTTAAPPTEPASSCDFSGTSFSVPSSNFAAVNCYYHLDELYRLMTTWGFNPISGLFPQTTFPVTAFYLDEAPVVNAHANGNAGFTALTNFTFGNEASGATVGIAVDWRIVMHEFNHHVLYDRVHSPNYGFAHNGGDAFAVIWFDPDSAAADKGLTFPWCSAIPRRHDRPVNGWAWGGLNDDRGYSSEQILSTSLMRAYKSAGGGAAEAATRRLASRHVVFLKIHADARLGPSPIVSSTDPRTYVTALQQADIANTSPDGVPGGTLGKVFRWAFEKQGLYQPPGAPTPVTTPGAPPDIDVYFDDARHGEYDYVADFWDNTEVWNRRSADGGSTHEEPILRTANYAYARISNRGTTTATGIVVRGYHARPSAGLTWPDDWSPMTTSQLTAPDLAPGASGVVGPFTWVPTEAGHECMLMEVSCPGDRSNVDILGSLPCAFGPTPHWRLIPFDNNLAQRNVAPVAAGGGIRGLVDSLHNRPFFVINPFDRNVRVKLEPDLPSFLVERGWKLRFTKGMGTLTLGPRADREVRFTLEPGRQFTAEEVRAAGADLRLHIRMRVDDSIVGGMSYELDPALKRPPHVVPTHRRGRLDRIAEELLEEAELRGRKVKDVNITHIVVDIELADESDPPDDD
jgi:zinc metalloprotease ZmpB